MLSVDTFCRLLCSVLNFAFLLFLLDRHHGRTFLRERHGTDSYVDLNCFVIFGRERLINIQILPQPSAMLGSGPRCRGVAAGPHHRCDKCEGTIVLPAFVSRAHLDAFVAAVICNCFLLKHTSAVSEGRGLCVLPFLLPRC